MLTITITDPPFSFVADTTETVLNFTVSDQVGPAGTTLFSGLTDKATADIPTINTPLANALSGKQVTLVSGTNIKTINGTSLLGSGDIEVGSSYTLPTATDSVLGGIKSSTDILVDAGTGVATVNASTGATPNEIVRRGSESEAYFGSEVETVTSDGVSATSGQGIGVSARSNQNSALKAVSVIGDYHAEFGNSGDNRSFIARVLGAFGWWRRNAANDADFNGRIQAPATLEADTVWTLPSVTCALANAADIPSLSGYQTTAGTLALGGFSSITGTVPASNISALGTPASGTLTNCTGLPTTGISGTLAQFQTLLGIQVKKSTAQMDVTTSTTYVDITGMTNYSLDADSVYQVVFFGQVTCGAAGGYKVAISSTQAFYHTASGSHGFGSLNQIGGTVSTLFQLDSTSIIVNSRTAAGTNAPFMTVFCIRTGASAPTVKFQFAQNVSSATTSSLIIGAVGSFTKLI